MNRFNIRVYGVLINEINAVLLSDERRFGASFTKFPGGGLEWGEGLKDALKREFQEEFKLEIEVHELFYVNDFFQQSAFNEADQIVSFYYRASLKTPLPPHTHDFPVQEDGEFLRWQAISSLTSDMLNFPIDKCVVELLIKQLK